MTNLKNFLFVLAFFCGFSAFADDYRMDITAKSVTIDETGGVKHFYITSAKPWSISCSDAWFSVSPMSGIGNDKKVTISVNIGENPDPSAERNGVLTFTSGEVSTDIPVTQVYSDDYYKEGNLITLSTGSEHGTLPEGQQPIAIALVGDGWDLSDYRKGGFFEQYAQAWSDWFFQMDVIKDMPEYFNVYAYVAISECRGIDGFPRFGTTRQVGPIRVLSGPT